MDFAHAMKVKLRLNREKSARAAAEEEAPKSEQLEPDDDTRHSIARKAMEDNPGITEEKALEMMEFLGG